MLLAPRFKAIESIKGTVKVDMDMGRAYYHEQYGLILFWPQFPTHFIAGKKWYKPSGNTMLGLNGRLRSMVVASMKEYFRPLIQNVSVKLGKHAVQGEAQAIMEVAVPVNWGDVRRTKKGLTSWNLAPLDYEARWDLDNWFMYHKVIQDVLQERGLTPSDTVDYYPVNKRQWTRVEHLDHRYLAFSVKTLAQ